MGAFKGLLGALDALAVERDTLRQTLLKEPQSPGQADLSCSSCMRTTLKYSTQCSDLQSQCTSLQLTLAQRTKDLDVLSADLETSKFEKENVYLRWENAKKAASCICYCKCGARSISMDEDLEDVKQLKQQLADLQTECDRLKADSDAKQQEVIRLDLEVNVSEERFIGCKAYKLLMNQAKALLDKLGDVRRQYKSLDKKLDKQRREHESEMKSFRSKYKDMEHDLTVKATEQLKLVEKLSRERDAKNVEISQLQMRIAKWQEHEEEFTKLTERLEGELGEARKKVAEYSQLNHTLKQKCEDVERGLTETKLNLTDRQEKVAALNQHIAELTAGLSQEPNPEARAVRLQKEREDLIHKLKARDEELHQLKTKLNEYAAKLKAEQEAFNMMHREYDATAAAFDKEAKKVKSLTQQLAQQDKDIAQLLSSKLGFEEERRLIAAERQAAELLIAAKDEVAAKLRAELEEQNKLIEEYRKKISECRAQIKENEDQLARATQMYENNLKEREETLSEKDKAIELCKALETKLAKSHEACAERTQRVQLLDQELAHLNEEILKKDSAENQRSTDERLNQQLDRFRVTIRQTMVRCSLCSSNLKDVVINKCFHAFCKSCIDTNLEKRQRKCPRCKTKFGSADVRTFYWL